MRRLERDVAWAQVIPDNEGTVTSGLPDESFTSPSSPPSARPRRFGLCNTTSPAATVIDVTGAPSFRFIWTLATAALACANGRFTTDGVGCEGVNTFVPKAAKSPAARITANRTAPPIHHYFWSWGAGTAPRVRRCSRCAIAAPFASPTPCKARHRRARPAPPWSRSACRPQEARGRSPFRRPPRHRRPHPRQRQPRVGQLRHPRGTESGDGCGVLELGMISGRAEGDGKAEASAPSRAARPAASRRAATSGAASRADGVQRPQQVVVRQGLPKRRPESPWWCRSRRARPVTAS